MPFKRTAGPAYPWAAPSRSGTSGTAPGPERDETPRPGGPTRTRARRDLAAARRGRRGFLRQWLIVAGLVVTLLVAVATLASAIGNHLTPQAIALATLAAVLPLGIVVPSFIWLDRYEAEPKRHLLFAFGWGALVATTVSAFLNAGSLDVLNSVTSDSEVLAAVAVAPVVEESLKGLGVLLILVARRREFDGVVDGIVYAGLCAAGFAFAENVLYLGHALDEGGAQSLVVVFLLRCILGPFAHPLFTCCTGVGIGLAAASRNRTLRSLGPPLGFLAAVLLHASWNLSAVIGLQGFLTRYLLLQLPIFVAALSFAIWARYREGRTIALHLSGYAAAGWLTAAEVAMLASMPARRGARAWAARYAGAHGEQTMRAFQENASELAMLRMHMDHGTAHSGAQSEELALLAAMNASRRVLLAADPVSGRPTSA